MPKFNSICRRSILRKKGVKNNSDNYNEEGFLLDYSSWDETQARAIARILNIILSDEHWIVIKAMREIYEAYDMVPTNRAIITAVRKDIPEFSSLDLQRLFPDNPIISLCKISGLPKPERCL